MLAQFALERIDALKPAAIHVALSGGVDSVVLLHLATRTFGSHVKAIHVHHGLIADADRFEAAAAALCETLRVPLVSRRVTVDTKGSLEANARTARYAVFEEIVGDGEVILLAHHRDDQVETILHTLFRGGGRFGVTGMPRERRLGRGHLLRPLINASRGEIVDYARRADLHWVEDPSNADLQHTRNAIRHIVLPALEAQWPEARTALLEALERDEQYRQVIDSEMEKEFGRITRGPGMDADGLLGLTPSRRLMVVRFWIDALGLPQPSNRAMEQGLVDVLGARDDGAPLLSWQGVGLRRYRNVLYLGRLLEEETPVSIDLKQPETAFGAGLLRATDSNDGCVLRQRDNYVARPRAEGMTVRLRHTRPVKKVMQEMGVPPWLRDQIPVICCGDDVAAIPGLPDWGISPVVADDFAPKKGEAGLELSFRLPGQPYSR